MTMTMTMTIDSAPIARGTGEAAVESGTLSSVQQNPYWRLWQRVPRELGFLILTLPIATVSFSLSITLFSAGLGLIVTFFIGVLLLIALFYVSRGFGTLEIVRLQWAGQPPIARPEWRTEKGFWPWLRSMFANGHYWLYTLHTMVVNFVVSVVSWTLTVAWVSIALGGVTYWFWGRFLPAGDNGWFLSRWLVEVFGGGGAPGGIEFGMLDAALQFLLGIVFLATLPFVTRGLVKLHHVIAVGMLSAFTSDALRRQVLDLNASRGAAISAEGHSLRRLERDIHDGPQQRLVRLQMDLASAERKLDSDPDATRALIAEAKERAQETLDELRALSRGFAPPILLDRGLVAALQSLAARSAVPMTVASTLDPSFELPQEIERNAYFIASELATNAAKHSGANSVVVAVGLRRVPERDDWWLDVTVTDDGVGGAASVDGHGLAGLDERVRGLGGVLTIDSPAGGPTVITGHLPVTI